MIDKIIDKYNYWTKIIERRKMAATATKGHQVHMYNWCNFWSQDMWYIDFIEKRGLLKGKPNLKLGLYSIFAPMWLRIFDNSDIRIFQARENLHKKGMEKWLHQFVDDPKIDLSIGFDYIDHPQYLRIPFWLTWNVFSPTDTFDDIKNKIARMNSAENHSFINRKFSAFLSSHDDIGRSLIFNQMSKIDRVDCDGKLFHNNDELKCLYGDNKLEYLKHYRFNITPENTNYKGYVTEKLFEAIYAGCVPIYNGGDNYPEPDVLNQEAIIFVEMGRENIDAVKLVSELNSDEKKYMDFACQKRFVDGAEDVIWGYYETLEKKLREIIANV